MVNSLNKTQRNEVVKYKQWYNLTLIEQNQLNVGFGITKACYSHPRVKIITT